MKGCPQTTEGVLPGDTTLNKERSIRDFWPVEDFEDDMPWEFLDEVLGDTIERLERQMEREEELYRKGTRQPNKPKPRYLEERGEIRKGQDE